MKGIRLDIAEYRRPDPATAPALAKAAGLYMICTISKHRAERRGYADALMSTGRAEWRNAPARTFLSEPAIIPRSPIASSPASPGRRSLILRASVDSRSSSARILPAELGDFDECFITGTAAEVTPVGEIGPHHYKPAGADRSPVRHTEQLTREPRLPDAVTTTAANEDRL